MNLHNKHKHNINKLDTERKAFMIRHNMTLNMIIWEFKKDLT